MFTIQSDHLNYKTIRDQLIADPYAEAGPLIELADVKVALNNASPDGLLNFVGESFYKDKTLDGIWVQKILGFRRRASPSSRSSRASKACSAIPACGRASASRSSRKSRASAS